MMPCVPHLAAALAEEKTAESFGAFISRNPFEPNGRTARDVDTALAELRGQHGAKAIGGLGVCWGGYHLIHAAQHADKVHSDVRDSVTWCCDQWKKP